MNKKNLVEGDKLQISLDLGDTKPGEVYSVDVQVRMPDGTIISRKITVTIMPKIRARDER